MQRSIARSNKLQGPLKQDPGNPGYRKSLSRPGGSRVYSSHPLMPAFLPPDPNQRNGLLTLPQLSQFKGSNNLKLNNSQICFFHICAAEKQGWKLKQERTPCYKTRTATILEAQKGEGGVKFGPLSFATLFPTHELDRSGLEIGAKRLSFS
jgi:hypothetical protein